MVASVIIIHAVADIKSVDRCCFGDKERMSNFQRNIGYQLYTIMQSIASRDKAKRDGLRGKVIESFENQCFHIEAENKFQTGF